MSSGLTPALLLLLFTAAAASTPAYRSLLQTDNAYDNLTSPPAAASDNASPSSAQSSSAINISQVTADVQRTLREPEAKVIKLKTEFNSEGTSISVGEANGANTLAVQVRV